MARARLLKIGFFENEDLAQLDLRARMLYAGLWLLADRAGRLEDRPRRIHVQLFPYEQVDVDQYLNLLASAGFVHRYAVKGRKLIQIPTFCAHQSPHLREPESKIPPPQVRTKKPSKPSAKNESPGLHGASTGPAPGQHRAGPAVPDPVPDPVPDRVIDPETERDKGEMLAPLAPSPAALVEIWNTERGALPPCVELTDKRTRLARQRLTNRSLEEWRDIIRRIRASDFCRGENERGWQASFDWILEPDVGAKVLEGKYDNRPRRLRASSSTEAAREFLRRHLGEEVEGEVVNADANTGTKG